MSETFMGELRIVAFNFAPKGWAMCNGQFLPINQNQALFSLLGTMYGGNGQTTFALPDLRGRVPIHFGSHTQGEVGGAESVTINASTMATHSHTVTASLAAADNPDPVGRFWGSGGQSIYSTALNTAMAAQATNNVGGSQPHTNMQPYLVLNYIINLQGIFPSRN